MSQPAVSVIITNYNYDTYLPEAIESALEQSYEDLEVIVVDDGSTDDSRSIIEGYGNRVIPIFKENGGQASAFNAGFERSEGGLVCFLDADDVWKPDKIKEMVRLHRKKPAATLLYHRVRRIQEDGTPFGSPRPWGLWHGDISDHLLDSGGGWACAPTSATCYPRSLLQRVMPVPKEVYRIAADAYLHGVAPFLGPVASTGDVLAGYRLHGDNYWANSEARSGDPEAVAQLLEQIERNVSGLNAALEDLGRPERVDVGDNFYYQRLRRLLGRGEHGILSLAGEAWTTPLDPSIRWRLAATVHLLWDTVEALKRRSRR